LHHAEIGGIISEFPVGAGGIADTERTISVKVVWTREEAASVEMSIGPARAGLHADQVDVVNVVVGNTAGHTCPIVRNVLYKKSVGAYVYTHFDVAVCICEHLDSAVPGAVGSAVHVDRIPIMTTRTLSSVNAEFSAVEESILGAGRHALVLHTTEGIVDIVVNWTGHIAYPS
jgi:hypothetical protein